MKIMKFGLLFLLLTVWTSCVINNYDCKRPSFKHFGQIAYFFETKKDMEDFFDFKKHDFVAEVGAAEGLNILDLTLLADSVTFYLQDIDSLTLSSETIKKIKNRTKKLKKPLTNNYLRTIGTPKSTNLPDNMFDKIILVMTFHEFEHMEEMLTDLYNKLKPSGKLYILEARCFLEGHQYFDRDTLAKILINSNFKIEKIEGDDLYRSKDLYRTIFSKN